MSKVLEQMIKEIGEAVEKAKRNEEELAVLEELVNLGQDWSETKEEVEGELEEEEAQRLAEEEAEEEEAEAERLRLEEEEDEK